MDETKEIPADRKVYRCEYCRAPVVAQDIAEGGCICGSRRMRAATYITEAEMQQLKERGYEFDASYWMDAETAKQERRMEREVH